MYDRELLHKLLGEAILFFVWNGNLADEPKQESIDEICRELDTIYHPDDSYQGVLNRVAFLKMARRIV